ncbi:zincin-like metallopeptidase domain-containing protein [Maridesulfovibrio sp.]|uniref:zincin-like metallopeptidase domain-containing protein n=1 Tax=Maridesulfovibrio sp. TaxID=2795000 RepID=UPI0029F55214|nr:zincin-like metallopeptidase domain-containing protein [Maridesulfovibrio sp.]
MAKDKTHYYQRFAEEIIDKLEKGTAPWQRPWKAGEFQPAFNPVSGAVYRGINQIMLSSDGLNDPRFMTYKQAESKGWQVRKGSKSKIIVFWQMSQISVVKDEDGKPERDEEGNVKAEQIQLQKPILRFSNVFHASQIDGIPEWDGREISWNPDERAEAILENSGASISHDQRNRAFYKPSSDEIHLPPHAAFDSPDKYYSTALHELGHWTGHESRLDREFGPFGSEIYAKEELRAEIASWMTSAELGISHNPEQHASYVKSWVKVLKEDPYEIVRACQSAEKIKDYTLGLEKERAQEQTKEQGMSVSAPDKAKLEQRESKYGVPENGKTWLKVPFSEKNQAKQLGAKWDQTQKMWFAPEGEDVQKFAAWLPENKAVAQQKETPQEPRLATEKTYLNVPYREKGQAKKLGARWDKSEKLWFASSGTDLTPLAKWLPKEKVNAPQTNAVQEFTKALQEAGLDLQGQQPIMDGTLQRVPVIDGKPNSKDGAYKGFLDARPAGFIQNHKTGLKMNWKADGHELSAEEKALLKAQAAQKRIEREKALAEQREKASKRSFAKWTNAKWATKQQEYLQKKGVPAYGVKVNERGDLLVPGRDTNSHIHTLQTITPDGKLFEKGGLKAGMFHTIDPGEKIAKGGPILVAEGYATAASAHMASNMPTVVAFDASNLEPVAKALKAKYPKSSIVLVSDNDHHLEKNVGIEKAEAAAKAVGGLMTTPKFNKAEKEQGLSDFNDLHKSRGIGEVQKQMSQTIKMAKSMKAGALPLAMAM